jgi:hypothetical protein
MDASKDGGIIIIVTLIMQMESLTPLLLVTRLDGIKVYANLPHIIALNIKVNQVVGNLVVKMVGGIITIVKALTQNQDSMLTDTKLGGQRDTVSKIAKHIFLFL